MKRENIHYSTSDGFLKDPKYTADLLQFLSEYKDKFGQAETLEVSLEEIPYSMLDYKRKAPIHFSDDGKKVTITFTTHRYYDTSGKATGKPDPIDVYRDLRFIMDKAVKEYSEIFIKR
jgi:hypothetical protein